MSQTISRMYATPAQAARAKASLEHEGYSDVYLVASDGGYASADDIVAAITRGNVLKSHALVYAERIAKGGSLVTVHAPFTGGGRATQILEEFSPIESGISEPVSQVMPWDEATPMSCILQIPVLLDNPTPFASFWNVPTLSGSSVSLSRLLGMPLLKRFTQRSSSFGLPLLSHDAAPLSSLLRLPTLVKQSSARR